MGLTEALGLALDPYETKGLSRQVLIFDNDWKVFV